MSEPIRVLVVDDSALVRSILSKGLSSDPQIDVVATASDPFDAKNKILSHKPQVITLDVEMPKMDGVEFLRQLMPQFPIPTIMVSALTEQGKKITFEALEIGAVDFVSKPKIDVERALKDMMSELIIKVKAASTANVSHFRGRSLETSGRTVKRAAALDESTDKVVAIGASTGGTEAIKEILVDIPRTFGAGIVIVQHMPPGFTQMFAERLDSLCEVDVKEAKDGDKIMPGRVLIAPGGKHLRVVRFGGLYRVKIENGDLVCGHKPSVEVMMSSVAEQVGKNAIGVMLTGMGRDGAIAMKKMKDRGARCIAQDQATSVVFGMPNEAFLAGAVEKLLPIGTIANNIIKLLREMSGVRQ